MRTHFSREEKKGNGTLNIHGNPFIYYRKRKERGGAVSWKEGSKGKKSSYGGRS